MAAQEVEQRAQHHLDPFDDRLAVAAAARGLDRAFEVVGYRQQIAQQALALESDAVFVLLAHPFADVFGIGQSAEILVLELGDFLVLIGDLLAQRGHFGGLRRGQVVGLVRSGAVAGHSALAPRRRDSEPRRVLRTCTVSFCDLKGIKHAI